VISRRLLFGALASGVTGCTEYNQQSVLNPAGPQSTSTHQLFIFMLVVAALVYVVVVGGFLLVVRSRRLPDAPPDSPRREADATRAVKIAVGVVVPILFIFLVYDLAVAHGIGRMPTDRSMLTIDVTGRQWWWDVVYEDPVPQNSFHTANEIHIPVGIPVRIKLASHDVIHSFWIPNLAGKKDLIPGHDNEIWIRADKPGTYRGPCAEFCGIEHAKMALFVVAEPQAQFAEWILHQRQPSVLPSDSLTSRGFMVFKSGPCATCHTIAGTGAAATVGPDLTHLQSRSTIAAGTLQNTRGNLAGWILDPQTLKPGAKMPPNAIAPNDFQALLAYLETLK
jgi:cytochrome c oxidase subunit II